MPNPRLHLTHEIRRAVGVVGSEPTIMGGNALAKTGVHALDGPEHTPPTLGGDLQGAGATLEVRALQGVALGDLSGIADGDTLVYQAASSSLIPGAAGGGGMFGDIEGGTPTSIYGGTDPIDGGTP